MKAIVYTEYGSPDVLQFREVETPVPKDHEVLIRIAATTVTPVDCTFRQGDQWAARLFTGLRQPRQTILGSDLAGVIEAVGNGVSSFKEGDRVFGGGSGTHAEYVCVPEDGALVAMPDNVTFEQAAAVPYGVLTALPFLRDTAHLQRGQAVLIIGASGSIGTFAVQLAKHFGADVTGVCSTTNVDLVRSLGADHVIDYTKEDFTTQDARWDVIFDTVGKNSFSRCKGALKQGGIYLTTVFSLPILLQKAWTSKVGGKRAAIAFTGLRPPGEMAKDLAFVRPLLETGALRPVIDRRYALAHVPEAHRYVERGHKRGNVVITPGPNGEPSPGASPD